MNDLIHIQKFFAGRQGRGNVIFNQFSYVEGGGGGGKIGCEFLILICVCWGGGGGWLR